MAAPKGSFTFWEKIGLVLIFLVVMSVVVSAGSQIVSVVLK